MAHLGPDGERVQSATAPIGVGYQAFLTVTQEDAFDQQPLADSESRTLLAADLRLDNREALAEALAIAAEPRWSTTPDSALAAGRVSALGRRVRPAPDRRLRLRDLGRSARRLVLARDHMGQRHLFFHRGPGFFAFATEISGLWAAPDVPRRISDAGFEEALARRWHQRPAGRTKYEGIESLRGGTILTVQADGAVAQRRYWEPHAAAQHLNQDETYYREAYRSVLEEAVACRVRRATRPCSLLLSGGFDSAAIAALAGPALGGRELVTVSSVLEGADEASPTVARRWVELCRRAMPHLDVRYATRAGRSIFSTLPAADADDAGSVNRYVNDEMFRMAAGAGARVIMDGHGGDYTLNPRAPFPVARLLAMGRFRAFASEFVAQARAERTPLWRSAWRHVLAAFVPAAVCSGINGLRPARRKPAVRGRRSRSIATSPAACAPASPDRNASATLRDSSTPAPIWSARCAACRTCRFSGAP